MAALLQRLKNITAFRSLSGNVKPVAVSSPLLTEEGKGKKGEELLVGKETEVAGESQPSLLGNIAKKIGMLSWGRRSPTEFDPSICACYMELDAPEDINRIDVKVINKSRRRKTRKNSRRRI